MILCSVSLNNHKTSIETGPNTTEPEQERSIAVCFSYFGAERVKWATIAGTFRQWTMVNWPLVKYYTSSQLESQVGPRNIAVVMTSGLTRPFAS